MSKANSPFPNCLRPLFRSESWSSSFHMQTKFSFTWKLNSFSCEWKFILHMKSWAPTLDSKKRLEVIRKWPSIWPEPVLTFLKTDSFNLQVKAVKHVGCWENTKTACKSLGQRLVVYKLFPLTDYCAREPIESVVYCFTKCFCALHLFFWLIPSNHESLPA